MEIQLYFKLSTCSKRALTRTKGKFGKRYSYRPRSGLLKRLSNETGMTKTQVYNQLLKERSYLLEQQ